MNISDRFMKGLGGHVDEQKPMVEVSDGGRKRLERVGRDVPEVLVLGNKTVRESVAEAMGVLNELNEVELADLSRKIFGLINMSEIQRSDLPMANMVTLAWLEQYAESLVGPSLERNGKILVREEILGKALAKLTVGEITKIQKALASFS